MQHSAFLMKKCSTFRQSSPPLPSVFLQERRKSLRPHRDLYYYSSDDEQNASKTKRMSDGEKTTVRRSTRASATPSKKTPKDDSIRTRYNLRSDQAEFSSEDESSFVVDKRRSSKKIRMSLSESRFKKQLTNIKKAIHKSSPYKTSTPQVSPTKTSETTDSPSKVRATKRLQFDSTQRMRTRTADIPPMITRRQRRSQDDEITVSEEPPTVAEADDSEEEEVQPVKKSPKKRKAASKPVSEEMPKEDKTEEEKCFPVTWREFALASFVTGLAGLGYLCYTTDYCRYC